MSTDLICQVDHFACSEDAVFLFGWALHPLSTLRSAGLTLTFSNGIVERVSVELHKAREDVGLAFPQITRAGTSGFLTMAGLPAPGLNGAVLSFETTDGAKLDIPLTLPNPAKPAHPRSLKYLGKRALAYIRLGKIELVRRKAKTFRFRDLLGLKEGNAQDLAECVKGRLCQLVLDHAMGGGANIYRETRVDEWLAKGLTVVLVTFRLDSLAYSVSVRSATGTTVHSIRDLEEVAYALGRAHIEEIFFNCGVSFPKATAVQRFILAILKEHSAKLVLAVHEYYLVCPSNFLLDKNGAYCGVPGLARCAECLPVHPDGFVSLTGVRSIPEWRSMWAQVLEAATTILCFSNSSRDLLGRAYPATTGRVEVRPHPVPLIRKAKIVSCATDNIVIGVIGSISEHKGAHVIASLSQAILATGSEVRIVVIGTLDRQEESPVVNVTGPFLRERLPGIIEELKVNIALLPSICPETFSFVAHEIIAMGLPIVCFDLGAQADLVRAQHTGLVTRFTDGLSLLKDVVCFKNSLDTAQTEAKS